MTVQQPNTSRRQFIQTVSAAGVATAAHISAPKVHAAASDTLKIGLIGCGGRGNWCCGPSFTGRQERQANGDGRCIPGTAYS